MSSYSLCWNCKKATGGCSWAEALKPINGWTATYIKKTSSRPYDTYMVEGCPEFIRDAFDGGLKRYKEDMTE